jgi:hypothetical protein
MRLHAPIDALLRLTGFGPNFPIPRYDELTASEVQRHLEGLSAPQLRKVRDHERRNANRNTVLGAIDRRLP